MRWRSVTEVTMSALEDLVTNGVAEDRHLEYKEELPTGTDSDKREFLADVASFANGAGGYLLYGVRETREGDGRAGRAGEIIGVLGGADAIQLRLESMIRDGISPRIPGVAVRTVSGAERGVVVVVSIPRSWNAPHMVSLGGNQRFVVRAGSGKHVMDVHEIRQAVLSNKTALAAARELRVERVGRIMAGEAPLQLRTGTTRWIVHLMPTHLDAELDLAPLEHKWTELAPLPNYPVGLNNRWNLDGHLTYASNDSGAFWYAQIMRRGVIEVVEANAGPDELHAVGLERLLFHAARRSMASAEALGMVGPWFLATTLVGARGYGLKVGSPHFDMAAELHPESHVFDRDPLLLPEVELGRGEVSLDKSLRPICDSLWQASGRPRSASFDGAGVWRQR